jgi:hypothetical protein
MIEYTEETLLKMFDEVRSKDFLIVVRTDRGNRVSVSRAAFLKVGLGSFVNKNDPLQRALFMNIEDLPAHAEGVYYDFNDTAISEYYLELTSRIIKYRLSN